MMMFDITQANRCVNLKKWWDINGTTRIRGRSKKTRIEIIKRNMLILLLGLLTCVKENLNFPPLSLNFSLTLHGTKEVEWNKCQLLHILMFLDWGHGPSKPRARSNLRGCYQQGAEGFIKRAPLYSLAAYKVRPSRGKVFTTRRRGHFKVRTRNRPSFF